MIMKMDKKLGRVVELCELCFIKKEKCPYSFEEMNCQECEHLQIYKWQRDDSNNILNEKGEMKNDR